MAREHTRASVFPAGVPAEDLERIGILAARSVGMDRALARRIGPRLAAAHATRRDAVAAASRQERSAPERPPAIIRWIWGVLCGVLAAALVGTAAMLGPLKRSSIGDPETSWPIALTAVIAGLVCAVLLLIVPSSRRGYSLYVAEVVFWVCDGLLVAVLLFRAFGGFGRFVEFAPDQLSLWALLAVPLFVVTGALALRWRIARGRLSPEERMRGAARPARASAVSLIEALGVLAGPLPAAVQDDWAARLEREERPSAHVRRVSAQTLDAVRLMSPVEVLARLHVDGRIDIEPLRRALN